MEDINNRVKVTKDELRGDEAILKQEFEYLQVREKKLYDQKKVIINKLLRLKEALKQAT
tara:strand:- start:5032 stop:5208 length:177 start_codon:yes stop_codon:yes gene_type:complete